MYVNLMSREMYNIRKKRCSHTRLDGLQLFEGMSISLKKTKTRTQLTV